MRVNRRQFLLGAGATAAFPALRHVGSAHAGELTPLRDRAAAKGFFYGAAPSAEQLQENPLFAEAIARECNVLVSAGELHMKNLRPTPTEFDFAGGDFLADFAAAHDMGYRGHALIWHWAFPEWANDTQPGDPAEVLMVDHIKALAGRYAGRMHSWDVVNEAINPWNGREDCLRETEWFELIGPEYVDLAFHTAAETDPSAIRVYNDYATEMSTPMGRHKRRAVLKVLERWLARGVPIQAFGVQAHLNEADAEFFVPEEFAEFLREVADFGLKIMVTELDVSDHAMPPDTELRDQRVASLYRRFLDTALAEDALIGIVSWGLSDRYSYRNWASPRSDGLPLRPLLLDDEMERKAAWHAFADAFDSAPVRDQI